MAIGRRGGVGAHPARGRLGASGPAVQARHEPFRVGIRSRRQLDEARGAGERREVARPVGGSGHRPAPPPVVLLEPHRQEKGGGGFTVTASPSATRSGGKGCWPRLALSEGST